VRGEQGIRKKTRSGEVKGADEVRLMENMGIQGKVKGGTAGRRFPKGSYGGVVLGDSPMNVNGKEKRARVDNGWAGGLCNSQAVRSGISVTLSQGKRQCWGEPATVGKNMKDDKISSRTAPGKKKARCQSLKKGGRGKG